MPQQTGQALVSGLDTGIHTLATQFDPQRQGIDKQAQGTVGTLATLHAAHQYGAEHHVFTAGYTAQHLRPGQMHQARGTYAQAPGMTSQSSAQCFIHRQPGFFDHHIGVQGIGETEWQGRLFNIREHVAKERFVGLAPCPLTCLSHIVAIGNRFGQRVLDAQQECLGFMLHQFQRSMVEGHMMEQQHRHPARVEWVGRPDKTHQRSLSNIHPVMAGVEALLQLPGDIAIGRVQDDFIKA
ncbi:hypothetical protein PSCICO_03100 [Pseudomonas cichorii]|nr:hypothetical protein PSCICO_03100 [Pseudomonas cichorii]